MQVVASRDCPTRHGRPQHPSELIHHECLGYTSGGQMQGWQFIVDGQPETFPVHSRIHANNGDVLNAAAAQRLGITCSRILSWMAIWRRGGSRECSPSSPLPN